MTTPTDARIVVGVDGSEQSRLALHWAQTIARATAADIEAVTVWFPPVNYGFAYSTDDWNPREDAEKTLTEAVDAVFGAERPRSLRLVVREGNPTHELLTQSEGATMLVLGSRGHGGFAGLLLGSVSAKCAEHAHCPVLVVHGADQPPTAS